MPRNMSFALTEAQMVDHSKTVTRRLGWKFLKVGDVLHVVKKCMGLKPGEKIEVFGRIRVTSVRWEQLDSITDEDVAREGFPQSTAAEFVEMFCRHMKCEPWETVTRIEFEHLEWPL